MANSMTGASEAFDKATDKATDKAAQAGRSIERQATKVPESGYIGLAFGSMALSAVTALIFGKRNLGSFFGLWVPSLLLLGVYRKVTKL